MLIIVEFIAIFHFSFFITFCFSHMKMHTRKHLISKEQDLFLISNFEMLHISLVAVPCSSLWHSYPR